MSSFSNGSAGAGGNNSRRAKALAANSSNRNANIFFFNKRILNKSRGNNGALIEEFQEKYLSYCNQVDMYMLLSMNNATVHDPPALFQELLSRSAELNDLLERIVSSRQVNNVIIPRRSNAFGSYGQVYTVNGSTTGVNQECLKNAPEGTGVIIKKYDMRQPNASLFTIFQENYLQHILYKFSPIFLGANGRRVFAIPKPLCIRKSTNGYYSYMEKVDGVEMFDEISRNHSSSSPQMNDNLITIVLSRIAKYLDHLQTRCQFLHNDLTIQNIMITDMSSNATRNPKERYSKIGVRLIDFGRSVIYIRDKKKNQPNKDDGVHFTITPYLYFCPSMYVLQNVRSPVMTAYRPYYDMKTYQQYMDPRDRTDDYIFDIIYKSQDLFYLLNSIMIQRFDAFLNSNGIIPANQRDMINLFAQPDLLNDLIQRCYQSEMVISSSFFKNLHSIFYTYHYRYSEDITNNRGNPVTVNKRGSIDILHMMYTLFVEYFSKMSVESVSYDTFSMNRPGGIEFFVNIAEPICKSILKQRGIDEGNLKELVTEVYKFTVNFRTKFYPSNMANIRTLLARTSDREQSNRESAAPTTAPIAASTGTSKRGIRWRNSVVTNSVGGLTNVFEIPTKEEVKRLTNTQQSISNRHELSEKLSGPKQKNRRPNGMYSPKGKGPRLSGHVDENNGPTTLAEMTRGAFPGTPVRKNRQPNATNA